MFLHSLYHSSTLRSTATYSFRAICSSPSRTFTTTSQRKMSHSHEGTTLKQKVPKQSQELPGLQANMEPEPFSTKLETASGPRDYTGVGKLRGKKALITGGEYVRVHILKLQGSSAFSVPVSAAQLPSFLRERARMSLLYTCQTSRRMPTIPLPRSREKGATRFLSHST